MLKEEKKVRDWDDDLYLCKEAFNEDVTALVRAVREECAAVADEYYEKSSEYMADAGTAINIAAAIRGKKDMPLKEGT